MPEFPSPITLSAPIFIAFVIIEWIAVKRGKAAGNYETKDAITSMTMGLGNVVVNTLSGVVSLWALMLFWEYRVTDIPFTWWSFAVLFVLFDFLYYWKHRFYHRMRIWWTEHVVHHSSEEYNLTTALRQPWTGPFMGHIFLAAPFVIAGFHPAFIFFVTGINLVYQFWIHTEAIDKMPNWFEAVFNTPSHHRVHHATNPRYLDSNYAGVFIIWDKMFGSFVPELETDRPTYGIVKPVDSYNPIIVAYHELAALIKDCARDGLRPDIWLRRMINQPGWSADGEHMRTPELKQAYLNRYPDEAGQPGLKLAKVNKKSRRKPPHASLPLREDAPR